ncbi:hypothetical protein [Tepidibacter thalassicus]|uniref:Uncharacterized protein n=1 Tax=Tepidibacter thalassicus DSM 15285 TaxID=1123350 RepID=A0A1M5NUS4_9FIRM|nr:hypothetical protein [Tepidibacter thalassicus]SHG93291.1 hypothetical protein SAMN02744040_00232 [Tepidibacter thalassicus DSM 15285]
MNINYVIILLGSITCIISLFFLIKFFSKFENTTNTSNEYKNNFSGDLLKNKLSELDEKVKNIDNIIKNQMYTMNFKNKEVIYSNEVERLNMLGYSKEEIAKKTNKSIREVDLILKLKK